MTYVPLAANNEDSPAGINFVAHVKQHLTSDLGKDIDYTLTSSQMTLN